MNTLDIILLLPLVFGLIKGAWSGLIAELTGLISVALGVFIAARYRMDLTPFVQDQLGFSEQECELVSFILIFLATFLLVLIIGKMLTSAAKWAMLGPMNRILGAVFGCLKYFFFVLVAMYTFRIINENVELVKPDTLKTSIVYSSFENVLDKFVPFIPNSEDFSIENGLNAG